MESSLIVRLLEQIGFRKVGAMRWYIYFPLGRASMTGNTDEERRTLWRVQKRRLCWNEHA
ncbi:hypothetical protein FIBSPDRAFT_362301 [Athelia psychrophila]|uniref:Uncharacterized protein n=1 Tax=Athelia psychrophila TaxID=1759441 RepID=A0A166PD22_9AGAM|nr:hypothetical protein FIBSPDRAFT_537474 [Fibularhizoctonia sp. CBS 109695]KZP25965.1 hypothetical protein FIBSPDRAFT_362301 [Fibularhizoctonia sp. CBS 109695]